jgi:low affinity Fe/Cu permease
VERNEAAETRQQAGAGRGPFERFVEAVQQRVSRAPFFLLCLTVVVLWAASYPLFPSAKEWQVVIHTVGSVLSILLLVLLENAGRRSEEAAQEKLNVLAEALAALMESRAGDDPRLKEALGDLREAVGLEEKH